MINPYKILGVTKSMTDADISMAYKNLAKKYHPDRCKEDNANEKMSELTEAYSLIKTQELRDKYEKDTAFSSDFGLYSSLFGKSHVAENFGKPPVDKKLQKNGKNIIKTVYMTNDNFNSRCKISIKYVRKSSCLYCSGTGATKFRMCTKCGGTGKLRTVVRNGNSLKDVINKCSTCNGSKLEKLNKCESCDGTGFINKKMEIEFIHDGTTKEYKFIGKGNSGINNGENGSLIVKLKVKTK